MGALAFIPIVKLQIKKCLDIAMPYIQINCDSSFSRAKLIHTDCRVIQLLDPGYNTAGHIFIAFNGTSPASNFPHINTNSATVFGKFRSEERRVGKDCEVWW